MHRLVWDPNKDPRMDHGHSLGPCMSSHPEIVGLLEECNKKSRAPTLLYESLEALSVKMGIITASTLGAWPGMKKLARQVAETGVILESVLMGIISKLYAWAVTLTAAIIGSTVSQEKKGFFLDLSDSIHQKTIRLL